MKRFSLLKSSKKFYLIPIVLFLLVVLGLWHYSQLSENSDNSLDKSPIIATVIKEPIQPIPLNVEFNQDKAKLGDKLFHDPQLSADNTISCASCHNLSTGGVDRLPYSTGIKGAIGTINAPTVFNSQFNFKLHWDGSAKTMAEQIDRPISAKHEMASNWSQIVSKLGKSSQYRAAFKRLYKDGITEKNIKDAIVTFEKSLYTPNSPFDKFLRGDKNALTKEEQDGYRRFKEYGCVSCHQGINVGGNMFQTFGLMGDYFQERNQEMTKADLGRFNVTGKESDRHVFKVPSLRNITLTFPYFHDGSAQNLEEAVATMGKYQLGRQLSSQDIDLIVKFLNTLTGEYQGKPL